MISRFFIDRPIFATVLSVAIALIGGIALFQLPVAQYPRITPPGISVSISYPGASADVVADTVGAPIEQEVNGVPGMLYMSSQSGNDGSYSLTVTFDIGTDVNSALVMVQNRVTLAMPLLPTPVQNQGITIRKRTPDLLMIINFFSPKGRYDDIYLSNLVTINVKDEILRVDGVSDVFYMGERDYSMRAWLDPQKLAAHNITATDVANAIRDQNADAAIGRIGQPPIGDNQSRELPLDTLARLDQPEQFADIIVKTSGPPPAISPTGVPMAASSIGTSSPTAAGATGGTLSSSSVSMMISPSGGLALTSPLPTAVAAIATGGTAGASSATGAIVGGGNTAGGAASTGGATTSGSAESAAGLNVNIDAPGTTTGGGLSSSDITSADTSAGGTVGANSLTGGVLGGGPPSPSTGLVRLRDLGRVDVGAQNYNISCRFDGMPSVGLGLYQLPGTNALDVAERVRAKMKELKSQFPDDVDYKIAYDTTLYIRDSIADVRHTLFLAVAIVGLVVLFFLQDWRAMVLPMIDVPVSLIGTFAVMAAFGFSLNNISLFGLVLTIGIVVDDAIVVLENIERQMANGLEARVATLKAMEEVTGPIIAVGLVLCAVFVPCALISGITGQFFRQFAVTITVSTIISAINAITMTPSRAVLIFRNAQRKSEAGDRRSEVGGPTSDRRPPTSEKEALPWWFFIFVGGFASAGPVAKLLAGHFGLPATDAEDVPAWLNWTAAAVYFLPGAVGGGVLGWLLIRPVNAVLGWVFRGFNTAFDGVTSGYGWTVGRMLRASAVVLLAYVALLGLTIYVMRIAPTGFIPQQDQGRLMLSVQLPDSSSLERTKEAVAKIEKITLRTEGVGDMVSMSGNSFLLQANSPNFASGFIVLKPFAERLRKGLSDVVIMDTLRKAWLREVPDAKTTVLGAPPVPGIGVAGGFKFLVEDRASEKMSGGGLGFRNLQTKTERLVDDLNKTPSVSKADTQFRANTPQLFLDIDRSKVFSVGCSLDDVNQTLDMQLGSVYVNSYNAFGRHWQVTVQAEDHFRDRESDIGLFAVRNNQNQMVTLGTLTAPRLIGGPISITRYNLYASAAVTGNVQSGYSTSDTIRDVDTTAAQKLPLSMRADWTELMYLQVRAGNTGMYIFALAVLCVFLALSALYESWALPAAVILVVPLCLLCSLAGVLFTGRDVNIFVQIGLVVLVALACKNAILIVEFGKQLTLQGQPRFAATQEASRLRLRPILMTSFAFIFGVLPLAVATGAGAEMRRSLGVAVFYGMLGVTLFGIFLTPVFFYVIQGLGESRLLASERGKAAISYVFAGSLGAAAGYLLALLNITIMPWSPIVGAVAGLLMIWTVRELGRQIGARRNGNGKV
jgi:multidrug efflux pump